MKNTLINLGLTAALVIGLFGAVAIVNDVSAACSKGKCSGTNKYKAPKKFHCPAARYIGMPNKDSNSRSSVSFFLDSRYRKSSPFPGCADKVVVTNLVVGQCYKITINGKFELNCDGKKRDLMPTDAFFRLTTKAPAAPIFLNGQSFRSVSADANQLAYNPSHNYSFTWNSNRDSIEFSFNDSNYIDNVGGVTVTIECCPPPPAPEQKPEHSDDYSAE
jgi:hypothetical protein